MSEIEQLKARIDKSDIDGVPTDRVRDDYEPIGAQMIMDLVASGEYITARVKKNYFDSEWRIFRSEFKTLIYEN